MDHKVIEQFYEHVILPNYHELDAATIRWKDHGRIGPDAWARIILKTQRVVNMCLFLKTFLAIRFLMTDSLMK